MVKEVKKKRKKVTKKPKKRGFTLIELLAVIIILGVLMIIAIPSVTNYIMESRKNAYVTTASSYMDGAKTKVNSAEIAMYDTDTTYYLPASCISLEKGGDSPFGELEEAYVVITYDGFGYDYYWTSRDSSNMGILLTNSNLLDSDKVYSNIKTIDTSVGIGDTNKTLVIGSDCDIDNATYIVPNEYIEDEGLLTPNSISLARNLKEEAVLDSIASKYVTSDTGINFNNGPSNTNGKGLYIRSGTENDQFPIYYYRGSVSNNHVIFAGFCWKIVRTTNTGGIKLIYNDIVRDGKCDNDGVDSSLGKYGFNSNSIDNASLGYMYGGYGKNKVEDTQANLVDSVAKEVIDSWYSANIDAKGFTKKIEDTVWCNDRSIISGTGVLRNATYYGSYARIGQGSNGNINPSLECPNLNDSFTVSTENGNGDLTYPVALLTADEVVLAGNSSYLGINEYWWVMTPDIHNGDFARHYILSGNLMYTSVGNPSSAVRPAISLKKSARFVLGDGTKNNPYVIE